MSQVTKRLQENVSAHIIVLLPGPMRKVRRGFYPILKKFRPQIQFLTRPLPFWFQEHGVTHTTNYSYQAAGRAERNSEHRSKTSQVSFRSKPLGPWGAAGENF